MFENNTFIFLLIILLVYHVTSGIYMTREILAWVPDKKRRFKLLMYLWLIPVVGINLANRKGRLGLFEESNDLPTSSSRTALLGLEEILNPGVKNHIEAIEKQRTELSETISEPDEPSLKVQNKSSHTTKSNKGL